MNEELLKTADENGQVTFAAAVYFDDEFSVDQKLEALTECVLTLKGKEQKDAEKYLVRLKQELDSEFVRSERTPARQSLLSTTFNLLLL